MEEVLAGTNGQVVVKLFGNDLETLDEKAREVSTVLSGIRGAADVQLQSPPGIPELAVKLNPERLAEFGFQPVTVLEDIQAAYQGTTATQIYQGTRIIDVAVILDASARTNIASVQTLMLQSPSGVRVPLGTLADVTLTSGRSAVTHDGASRVQVITCNVRDRDLNSFVADLRNAIASKVQFPSGTYPLITGEYEARRAAQHEIILYSSVALIGIVLLLYMALGNTRNLLIALANLPFALVGGVFAVSLTGGFVTVGSLVGFITLFGITTRNSIMMISHFEHLVSEEGLPWDIGVAYRGAVERLLPIVMTALVAGLGLLPLALGTGAPGKEIEGPMAIVIVGGLITSTALNLLLLPALCLRFGRFGMINETGDL